MQIIPAIDLRGGRVVRLIQGDPAQETRYSDDPAAVAMEWERRGALRLHLVDLDGALEGSPANRHAVGDILRAVRIPVQVGGGLRGLEAERTLLDLGAGIAILGTAAVRDAAFLGAACEIFPGRLAVGLDARAGRLAVSGWADETTIEVTQFARRVEGLPLAALIYTDIRRDGMLAGPDLDGLEALAGCTTTPVIASGGIASLEHIRALRALEPRGVTGAIIGKALYDGRLSLEAALAAGQA